MWWSLLLNRYVLGAISIAITIGLASWWWNSKQESLREEGRVQVRQEVALANAAAQKQRQELILENEKQTALLLSESAQRLAVAIKQLEIERAKRKPRISAVADAACVVPVGFVFDHDAALPNASGGPGVSTPSASDDRPSGIPLSVAAATIGKNYGVSAECLLRLSSTEEQRYRACVLWDSKFGTRSGCSR